MNYQFDPTVYNFLPIKQMPVKLKEYLGLNSFVKIVETSPTGAFWYYECHRMIGEHRWVISSGVSDKRISGHTIYIGCITSKEYAETLLAHLMGTTMNSGVEQFGKKRLFVESIPVE